MNLYLCTYFYTGILIFSNDEPKGPLTPRKITMNKDFFKVYKWSLDIVSLGSLL